MPCITGEFMKKLQNKKIDFFKPAALLPWFGKGDARACGTFSRELEGHFRNSPRGYQWVTEKCYAKLACKYVTPDKGPCLPDGLGKETAQDRIAAQSPCATRRVRWGVVPDCYRAVRGLLKRV
jgi:hypothetical protein